MSVDDAQLVELAGHHPHKPNVSAAEEAIKDFIGGTIGGIGLVFTGHPFDTLKVRLQTQPFANPMYSGLIDCAKKTAAREGLSGFYKGVLSPLAGQMFLNATQFLAWGQATAMLRKYRGVTAENMSVSDYAFAGVVTGLSCAMVECPIDFFKSQLQVQIFKEKPLFTTVPQAVKWVTKNYGIMGWYQGLSATVVRNMPYRALYFGSYEATRKAVSKEGERREDLSHAKLLLAGGVAGFTQWFFCYPLDVIKSSMQADSPIREQRQYRGYLDCARKLYEQGGPKMFFRGFSACMLRSFPANAACLFLYEKTRELLG